MKKIGAIAEKIYFGIGAAAMGLLAVLVIFTVIMRDCFAISWKSMSEFNVTLFAFTTFWGLGLNVLKNEHVSINMLYDHFRPGLKRWIAVLNCLIMLAVDCLFVHYSWQYTLKMGKQISQGMEIPMSFMYGIMPVCGVICALCIIIKIVQYIRAPLSAFGKQDKPLEEKQD